MSILDTILSETVCSNLVIGQDNTRYCKYLTNSVGRLHPVGKSFCNLTCKKTGPYNNKQLSPEDNRAFIIKSLKGYNPFFYIDQKFIDRVLKTYKLPVDIIIPDEYNNIKKHLNFLNDFKGFKKFLMTGSAITKNAKRPLKDLDVLLWFNNIDGYLNVKNSNILPISIDGIKVDYFVVIGDELQLSALFFCCLDVEDNKLYKSKWFELNLTSSPVDFEVVDAECEYFDIIMQDMFLSNNKPSTGCCGRGGTK